MPLIPQVSYRLDGEGSQRWASAPYRSPKQALGLATAWGGEAWSLKSAKQMESLYPLSG